MIQDIGFQFRQATDLMPSGKTSILGLARCSAEEMRAYIHRRNPAAPEVEELYLRIGERYGVRGDVAYCQAVYETKAWAATPAPSSLRRAGWIGSATSAGPGYDTEAAVEEQIVRLRRFAESFTALPIAAGDEGAANEVRTREPCWEDLNGVWRVPGTRYGQDVVAIWRKMLEWAGKGGVRVEMSSNRMLRPDQDRMRAQAQEGERQRVHAVDWSSLANEDMSWLQARGLLPQPMPHPERRVTWAELAKLLRSFEGPEQPASAAPDAASSDPENGDPPGETPT
ncbi:hypothetical protein [Cohnella sp. REN36]|uniref:hypothetical protein n=1 Tax=Cohnella sp. REN36 TaxID=2887347 RepID=UPI001D135468|nr:hypothetical protein [Cohnella sp. REN36]MCC3373842.1 hypothetical protein [Cohnella sp. REN36]